MTKAQAAHIPEGAKRIGEIIWKHQIPRDKLYAIESLGIIQAVRNSRGYRYYTPDQIEILHLYQRYRAFGFDDHTVRDLLTTKAAREADQNGVVGLHTKDDCDDVLCQLANSEAELWNPVAA